jgi:hypothetical protein
MTAICRVTDINAPKNGIQEFLKHNPVNNINSKWQSYFFIPFCVGPIVPLILTVQLSSVGIGHQQKLTKYLTRHADSKIRLNE